MLSVTHVACAKEHFFPMFFYFGLHKMKVQIYSNKIDSMCQALGN